MAYCTIADIQRLMKWFTFSATSKVTTTDITTYYIPEADTIIDSKLGRVYETPITDSDDLDIIKFISCRIVACEVGHVLVLQASGDLSDIISRWCEQAKEKLNAILTQDILLSGSTLLDTSDGRLYSGTAHGTDDEDAPAAIWKMNTVQW